jgi:hypothetical protein
MTGNISRVARPADMEPLISVMVLAFAADPVARWMYRNPQRYLAYFGRFSPGFCRQGLFERDGMVHRRQSRGRVVAAAGCEAGRRCHRHHPG